MELPHISNKRSIAGNHPMNISLLSPTTKSPLRQSPSIGDLRTFDKQRHSELKPMQGLSISPSAGNLLKASPSESFLSP